MDDLFISEVFRLGVASAALTHDHISEQLPAGVFALIIAPLLRSWDLTEATTAALHELTSHHGHEEISELVERAVALSTGRSNSPETLSLLGEGWVPEKALAISLYCALGATNFEDGVVLAVNHSGDSDSTGANTGKLLGAFHSQSAIPSYLLEGLELRAVSETVADTSRLLRTGTPVLAHPVPIPRSVEALLGHMNQSAVICRCTGLCGD